MSIIDDIRAQLYAPLKRYEYRVVVGGLQIQTAGPPRYSGGLDRAYQTMTIPIAVWDEALLVEGTGVYVEEALNGYWLRTFTGEIHQPDNADFPPSHFIQVVDAMWRATLKAGTSYQWAFEDETTIIKDLLTIAGVPFDAGGIEGGGWTMGTCQPIVLGSDDTPYSLIEEIDNLTGYRTMIGRDGFAYRFELPMYPGAADYAAFDYADNPTGSELGVLDRVQRSGSGRDGIRNEIVLKGPNLYGLTSVSAQQVSALLDSYVSLWYADVVPESVIVTDVTGATTYIRSDGVAATPDYEVDGPNGAIRALSTGAITEGQSLLVSYSYELTDGQIISVVRAENQRLPASKYQTENVPGGLAQDLSKADEITDRLSIELNRTHDVVTIPAEANVLLDLGQTISYRDSKVRLGNASPFMVTSIDRELGRMNIRAVGGDGGAVGVRDPRPPRARFTATVFVFGDYARVYVDGSPSWDPDGDIVQYDWSDSQANIATGVTTQFDYETSLGTVTISLMVTDALGLESPIYARQIDFSDPDFVLDVFARWEYAGPGGPSPSPGPNVSNNPGLAALLGRWFGDETAQGINSSDSIGSYGPLLDLNTPLAPYFNRQRFALAFGGWGWYPTYTIDRYAEETPDPLDDYVFTVFDGQKNLLGSIESGWQWWDSELAMGVANAPGPNIRVVIASTDTLSDTRFTRTITNAKLRSRGFGEKLHKIWFERENPDHIMVAAESYLYETHDQGATWEIPVSNEEAFGTSDAAIAAIAHGLSSWAIARYTAVPVTDAVFVFDETLGVGELLTLPVGIQAKTLTASPSANKYIVNDLYLIELAAGVWTITELNYVSLLDPETPEDPLPFTGDRLMIFHPVESDLIVGTFGAAWRAYLLYPNGDALRVATGVIDPLTGWAAYTDATTAITGEQINVAVMGHARPPVSPVTVLSSTAVKVYLGEPPSGWLNTAFDTSGWDNAIVVG